MDAIAKIHEFEKFGSILGLERMTSLMHELGDPQDDLKCIHVAGTNGKGSFCAMTASILQAAGMLVQTTIPLPISASPLTMWQPSCLQAPAT